MVGDMSKPRMSKPVWMAVYLLGSAQAHAQERLPDPTRPPPGLEAANAASAPAQAESLVLQSVLLGTGRAPAAVINGQLVPLGGLVGEMRLAQINELGVQLRGAQGTTTLKLTPEVQKQARSHRMEPTK